MSRHRTGFSFEPRRPLATLLIAAACCFTGPQAVRASDESAVLEEVVVTAQRRSEDAQDVPISITAVDESTIRSLGTPELRALQYTLPNVSMGGSYQPIRRPITIRGIPTDDVNMGFESGVGVYLDGVFMGRSSGFDQSLADVERVEVLRGPQGTLYGKNTIAGAINIITRKPGDTFEGSVQARGGNFGSRDGSLYVSGPLVDETLFGKISLFSSDRDGIYDNEFTGHKLGNVNNYGGRAQLRAKVGERWSLLLSVDKSKDDVRYVEGEVTDPNDIGYVPGLRTMAQGDGFANRTLEGASLQADYALPSGFTFTSITGYRKADTNLLFDFDRTPLPIINVTFLDGNHHATQELRLASPADQRLSYVVGAYYFDQRANQNRATIIDETALIGFDTGDEYGNAGHVNTQSYALYGQGSFKITPQWTVIVGARWNRERKKVDYSQDGQIVFGLPDVAPLNDHMSDTDVSPTIGLTFKPSDALTAYAKASEGYKSGGWNTDFLSDLNGDGTVTIDEIRFGREKLRSYEVGLKTLTWDRRLRLNVAAYDTDYDDLQVSQYNSDTATRFIRNAASATSRGFELEVNVIPIERLQLRAAVGYADAKFKDFPDADETGANFKGNRLQESPHWTGSFSALADFPLAGGSRLFAEGTLTYRSNYFTGPENDELGHIGGYALMNARLGWSSADERWEAFLWGRNLTNKVFVVDRFLETTVFPQHVSFFGEPRMYGAQVRFNFGTQ